MAHGATSKWITVDKPSAALRNDPSIPTSQFFSEGNGSWTLHQQLFFQCVSRRYPYIQIHIYIYIYVGKSQYIIYSAPKYPDRRHPVAEVYHIGVHGPGLCLVR